MNPNLVLISDGKKFMWDGRSYATGEEAAAVREECQKEGFEVRVVMEGGNFLVYTRRAVKGVVTTAA